MADSATNKRFEALLTPSVAFRPGLKIAPDALVRAAHQEYAFDPEARAAAIATIARTEMAKVRVVVEARLELITRPIAESEPGIDVPEDTRTTRQISDIEMHVSREVTSISDIILQIPDAALQQELAAELLQAVEDIPLVK